MKNKVYIYVNCGKLEKVWSSNPNNEVILINDAQDDLGWSKRYSLFGKIERLVEKGKLMEIFNKYN